MASYNDWLTINPKSGTGEGTVNVTISSHSGNATRAKKVNISANINGTTSTQSVIFNQNGVFTTGSVIIKADGSVLPSTALTPSQLKGYSNITYELIGTNADDFQYAIEVVDGNIDDRDLSSICNAPTFTGTTITDVTDGTTATLTAFTTTSTTNSSGNRKLIYSMDSTNVAKKFGANQTYDIHIKASPNASSTYVNKTSRPVTIKYSIAAVNNGTVAGITSFNVRFPANTGFVVSGGGTVESTSTTATIAINVPSDVSWTATTTTV